LREDGICGRRVTLEEEIYHMPISKPDDRDSLSTKEKFIQAKAREKFLSLRKSTKMDIVTESEEELRNARSTFEQARFNLVCECSFKY
jgi:hypothetical protein